MRIVLLWLLCGCSTIQTVRLQEENVEVGPGMRALAGIQASASSFYLLFIPIPGDVNLDRVVNRMLIVTAKTIGADKIVNLRFHVDSCQPSACFWTFLGVKTAEASGIAVQITAPPPDPSANEGPEPRPASERRRDQATLDLCSAEATWSPRRSERAVQQ